MDRQIKKKKWPLRRWLPWALLGLLVGSALAYGALGDRRSQLRVARERLTISTVRTGDFQEFVAVTGNVQPGRTYYLDAIEGGIVQRIHREAGALVRAGDTLLTLSNSALQLSVMNQESLLYEQLNNLRNTRLLVEQNQLSLRNQLAEINYQLSLLQPQYERFEKLRAKNLVSEREFQEVAEEYRFNERRQKLVYDAFRQDSLLRVMQLRQLADSEQRMARSLDAVGRILADLVVRAPADGQLASRDLDIGQAIRTGERLGQVDVVGSFRVRVAVDELYLPRVSVGQRGRFTFDGRTYDLAIAKVFPTIADGRFEVDMHFLPDSAGRAEMPAGLRSGQTLRIRLELGQSDQAQLLAAGGFYQDTGGRWVYVLDETGQTAVRRPVRIGRRNPDYYEVLEGLRQGERVIISSYENFGDYEVLTLR